MRSTAMEGGTWFRRRRICGGPRLRYMGVDQRLDAQWAAPRSAANPALNSAFTGQFPALKKRS